MIDVFRETRERVSAQDAARRYGLTFDRKGWAVCPFHRDKNPSMSFRAGRFRCWACNAAGDSIDFTGRLLGLQPLAAVERLNADFSLALPLHREPTPAEMQAARSRKEIVEAHRAFEAWRADMIQRLNACLRLAHLTMKNADLDRLTDAQALAIREQARLEWLSDTLSGGETEQQMQIFRERGADRAFMREDFTQEFANEVRRGLEADKTEGFLNAFKTLDQFEEQEATWLIPGWIPEGQIVLMASEGGTGKTSTWVDILAAISRGGACILDPPGYIRKPALTIFLTTEDSIRKKLRKKLRLAGADPKKIIAPDFTESPELLHDLKFGSPKIASLVRWYRPALVVFDPVQGFVPPKANMGSRNEMRDCLAPLISLGEETGTTFLLVCHTNKRKGAYGRDRIADSADLWDIARSVIMAGYTEDEGIRYLSNEKNNYTQLQDTILYSFDDDGLIKPEGTSWKRDRDYMQESALATSTPKRDDCREWLVNELQKAGGELPSKELEQLAKNAGYSFMTLRRAKDTLKKAGCVKNYASGSARGGDREWFVQLLSCEDTV